MLPEGTDWKALGLSAAIFAPRARYALAGATTMFAQPPYCETRVHPSAVVAPDAKIGDGVSIGPLAVIEPGEDRVGFAVGAARRLDAIADQVSLFDDGHEILPGVQALATYGHTPGHMSFVLGGKLVLLGDAVTDHHLSFERPDWPAAMDEIPEEAVASRIRVLDMAATDKMAVLGFHLTGDGIGMVQSKDIGFTFIKDA